jgi:hypothetical protein
MAQALVEEHGGEVPRTMPELVALPGVGRKTANVVLGNAFGIDEGVVVDTHVRRVSNRLGLTEEQDPEKIERDLMAVVPRRTGPCSRTCSSSTDAGYARPANPTASTAPSTTSARRLGTTKHPADLVPLGVGLTSSPSIS